MKWIVTLLANLLVLLPLSAETLNAAIQHSLIIHPNMLLNSHACSSPFNHFYPQKDSSFLKFKPLPANSLAFNRPLPANYLIGEVINHYFDVVDKQKLLKNIKYNLRLERSIVAQAQQQPMRTGELARFRKELLQMEKEQSRLEQQLQKAKASYATVVGLWPKHLNFPDVPTNEQLPGSLAQALELGFDNDQKPSVSEMSTAIRAAWEDWTQAGLRLTQARKNLTLVLDKREKSQQAFKEKNMHAMDYFLAQKKLVAFQQAYLQQETREIRARYKILNTIGKLSTYLTQSTSVPAEESLLVAASMPYPNLKPLLTSEIGHLPLIPGEKNYYISLGEFTNKANAMALKQRLSELGFMVFDQFKQNKTQLFIGPFKNEGGAYTGLNHLNEIAHVRGLVIAPKLNPVLG